MRTFTPTIDRLAIALTVMLMLTTAGLFPKSAFSQEQANADKTESPYFIVHSSQPGVDQLPLKSTKADVKIVGMIADVTVTQEYKNEGSSALEAIYTFPASSDAAIYAMEMTVGERRIVARIEEKQKAREQYTQAKAEGKRTSLLEQQRPNVFQMNVANIMPGDLIEVSLKYTEMLSPEEGTYQFVYPTVVGPRYVEHSSANDGFANTPYEREGTEASYDFDINLNLSTGMPIQHVTSTTHKVAINFSGTSAASIDLSPAEIKGGNRDFVLEYKLSGNQVESGLMLYEHGDEKFFMLMVQPPKRIIKEEIPPREYIFIVDVSGSMRGFPIGISKKLMRNLVVNLRPTDRFNVMVFSGNSGWMAEESLPATLENVEKASHFIDNQRGAGGTNLLSAMKKALTFPRCEEGLSRSFVVVTDGYISVEKEVFDMIRNQGNQANLFAFGIGSGVNRHLIEGMAHVGMSEPLIIMDPKKADEEAERFRKYINYPVLTDVKTSFSGFEAYDVEPVSSPDLLAERPLIIYGKYKGSPEGTITIKGRAGSKKYKKVFNVSDARPDQKHNALRYLWARKRIRMLDDYSGLTYGGTEQQEVTRLGLKYNLMTAYTSFIAIEEVVANEGWLTSVKQPLPLPQGVSNSAIGFDMEVEEDDIAFSFHSAVLVEGWTGKVVREEVVEHIESQLMTKINAYLANYDFDINAIEITIDKNGKVLKVNINGTNMTGEMKADLLKLIKSENFSRFKSAKQWTFKILF
ncbi:MAG: VIT and VWA domain-containing protein [Bacteroidota bacterium]